jgi:hypothetical protein
MRHLALLIAGFFAAAAPLGPAAPRGFDAPSNPCGRTRRREPEPKPEPTEAQARAAAKQARRAARRIQEGRHE